MAERTIPFLHGPSSLSASPITPVGNEYGSQAFSGVGADVGSELGCEVGSGLGCDVGSGVGCDVGRGVG